MPARRGRRSPRTTGRRDESAAAIFAVPIVNPKNPDMVYSASTVAYKSTDGGKSWVPSRAHRAATIIRTAGSTRTTRTSFCSSAIRARSSRSTAASHGVPGTTSRPRSSITSTPTTIFRIGWRSRVPSRWSRRSCCSTNRSGRLTPRCGRSCVAGSAACTMTFTSRASLSRTIRRRRWSWPTASRS